MSSNCNLTVDISVVTGKFKGKGSFDSSCPRCEHQVTFRLASEVEDTSPSVRSISSNYWLNQGLPQNE